MESWTALTDVLWSNALSVLPLALLVAAACHWLPVRPTTRHTLWLLVLLWFVAAPLLPRLSLPPPPVADVLVAHRSRPAGPGDIDDDAAAPLDSELTAPPEEPAWREPSAADPGDGFDAPEIARLALAPLCWLPGATQTVASEPEPSDLPQSDDRDEDEAMPVARPAAGTSLVQAPLSAAPAANTAHVDDGWRTWLAALLAVRDAVARVPSIPTNIWLTGAALLALGHLGAHVRHRPRLRAAVAAPPNIVELVAEIAGTFGMRGVPQVLMLNARVSPMVTCGRRPRLILPRGLWSQLDHVGRRAILCHELAHLRRRDHWVRWGELLICALYWWHPVAWWVRRRLRDEAELCCDAWVTWLLPQGRRAYAEALLRTKQYIQSQPSPVPAVGIGVTTKHARRFARRLKMVMTESTGPRLSIGGITLALLFLAASWLSTPLWACPPDSKDVKAAIPATPPIALIAPAAPAALAEAPDADDDDDDDDNDDGSSNTFAEHQTRRKLRVAPGNLDLIAPRAVLFSGKLSAPPTPAQPGAPGGHGAPGSLEDRLERLERQLERLTARMEQQPFQFQFQPGVSAAPRTGRAPAARGGGGSGGGTARTREATRDSDEVVTRTYHLPEGKLKALIDLMRRDDVPVRISPQAVDGGIEVHATERQHEVFKSFIGLIHPSEKTGASSESGQQSGALAYLLDHAAQAGAGAAQALTQTKAADMYALAQTLRNRGEAVAAETRARAAAEFAVRKEQLRAKAEELRHQARELQEKAESLIEQSREMLEHVRELHERADRADGDNASEELRKEARHIEEQSKKLERQAKQLEDRWRPLEERAQTVERQADEIETSANTAR